MVKNFRFEQPGIALSGVPETPEAVDWLHQQGIRTVVSLHPISPEVRAMLMRRGMKWLPLLVTDFAEGVPANALEVLRAIRQRADEEPAVLIH